MLAWVAGGAAALLLFFSLLRAFVRADARHVAEIMKRATGALLALVAVGLFLTGRLGLAIPVGMGALWLFGIDPRGLMFRPPPGFGPAAGGFGWPGGFARRGGQVSKIETACLAMELDHDSATLRGRVLNGPFAGAALADLTAAELRELHLHVTRNDPEGAALLETYLDRLFPDWRQWAPGGSGQGGAGAGAGSNPPRPGGLTADEALKVLELEPGADADAVKAAYHRLMRQMHPDLGGSTWMAAKLNEAKDVLLKALGKA